MIKNNNNFEYYEIKNKIVTILEYFIFEFNYTLPLQIKPFIKCHILILYEIFTQNEDSFTNKIDKTTIIGHKINVVKGTFNENTTDDSTKCRIS